MTTTRARGQDNRQSFPDWKTERDRIDLPTVVAGLLGPASGRQGDRGGRLWWHCPIPPHDDANPSFTIDAGRGTWKCFGCGEHGDAASLLMKVKGMTFPEAVAELVGGLITPAPNIPRPRPMPAPKPEVPSGLPLTEALDLVEDAEARLWSPEGAEVLAYLTNVRKLSLEAIKSARLGWTPRIAIPRKSGDGWYHARGIAIPWYDRRRLSLLKIRQPDGERPKYVEAFRDRPLLFPDAVVIQAGLPLVIPEGEFDALLLGQELDGLVSLVTLGSASSRPNPASLGVMLAAPRWYIATDGDDAGARAAEGWPARARRVRPPGPFKDWTEAAQAGVDLRRWWSDRLGGDESPPLFTWEELSRQRWGPAIGDPDQGIIRD